MEPLANIKVSSKYINNVETNQRLNYYIQSKLISDKKFIAAATSSLFQLISRNRLKSTAENTFSF